MEFLNKDELFTLALHLDLADLLNFSKTSKRYGKLCHNNIVWRGKIRHDFPHLKYEDLIPELQHKSPEEIYILLYTVKVWKLKMNVNDLYVETNIVLFEPDIHLIPEYLHLPNLKRLGLEKNQIKRIPDNLNLPELRTLSLCGNKITHIPNLSFPKLHNLCLTDNLIEDIPNLNSNSLGTLHLHGNKIITISPDLNLPNLRILDLNRNKISAIPPNLNLPNLEILRLKQNPITVVRNNQFPKLTQLEIDILNKE